MYKLIHHVVLLCWIIALFLKTAGAFLVVPSSTSFVSCSSRQAFCREIVRSGLSFSRSGPSSLVHYYKTRLHMASSFNSNDPFEILNLSPTSDKKEIKRAYKRAALQYHPDVVVTKDSTSEEKRLANDHFAKINWAYAQLSGKSTTTGIGDNGAYSSKSSKSYTPPHRRKAADYSYTNASTDWRDYMPKYDDDEMYDAGGDSFGQIFSDLLQGAAVGAAGVGVAGGGIFKDFVEFLEQNVDGYTSSSSKGDDDAELRIILTTGSLQEVGNEMDDTELVVNQLDTKRRNLSQDLQMRQADLKLETQYLPKMELEEQVAELQARKSVVDGYLQKARKRLLSLQTRYKQLVVGGENDVRAGSGRTPSSFYSTRQQDSSSTGSGSTTTSSRGSSSSTTGTSSSSSSFASDNEDTWKRQGFGSTGIGRGSSSRRSRASRDTSSRARASSSSYTPPSPPREESSYTSSSSSAPPPAVPLSPPPPRPSDTSEPWTPPVPPHRRPSGPSQAQKDKKRLRELQVNEEFEKLKKDLGL